MSYQPDKVEQTEQAGADATAPNFGFVDLMKNREVFKTGDNTASLHNLELGDNQAFSKTLGGTGFLLGDRSPSVDKAAFLTRNETKLPLHARLDGLHNT